MRLEFKDGTSNKFWEAVLAGTSFDVSWGRIGARGQTKRQKFASSKAAKDAFEKLVAEKKKKGYREAGGVVAPSAPRDEKLEAAIRANRDDLPARLVYSDFLQTAGDPLGELIAVMTKKQDAKLARRAKELIKKLDLLDPDLGELSFKWGLLERVRLENSRDWMDGKFDVRPVLEKLFGATACAALSELKVGVIRWDHHEEDLQTLFEVAAKHPWAKGLERLHLGDLENVDMAHHSIGVVGKAISRTFPGLRSLILHSGEKSWAGGHDTFDFAGLDLPELRELTIETCSMSKRRLKAVWAAKLPKLERLTLWFGSDDQGADCTVKNLAPLLEAKVFPGLTHLGLANAEFAADLVEALPRSKRAGQLESLDLSLGVLDDSHVEGLVAAAKAFPKLKRLDVRENFFSKQGVTALKRAYPELEAKDQKTPWEDDPDFRYVSVGE